MSVSNGWTGGQYSLFRGIFGTYLLVHFAYLTPWGPEVFSSQGVLPAAASPLLHLFPNVLALWDSPVFVTALLATGAMLSVLFAIGFWDRIAALALWYLWACLFGRNPLIANPSLPFVGWLLLAHVFLPPAPYGSWSASGRADPGGGWQLPRAIFRVAWIVMALGYSYSGYTKLVSPSWLDGTAMARVLNNPLARPGPLREPLLGLPAWLLSLATWSALVLELAFAPLALIRRVRPWLWGAMLLMHLSLFALIDFADLSLGMLVLQFLTFDPAWVPPRKAPAGLLFYDGHCGLCHRLVRFVLAEDLTGTAFRFAPLGGETFLATVPAGARPTLPDSVVVHTAEGKLLVRSAAVLYILSRLGGIWRLAACLLRLAPHRILDFAYDVVARVRGRLFRPPAAVCPLVPEDLRTRFYL